MNDVEKSPRKAYKDLQRVTVIGRLGVDPEIKTYTNKNNEEREICRFTLASTTRQGGTQWYYVSTTDRRKINYITKAMQKGDSILVMGDFEIYQKEVIGHEANDRYSVRPSISLTLGDTIQLMRKSPRNVNKTQNIDRNVSSASTTESDIEDDSDDSILFS